MAEVNTMGEELSEPVFTAGDVTRLAGLSYRQINDWDARAGVMNSDRNSAEGWRKFNLLEVFGLCVCAKLRDELHLPLDKIASLYRWLVTPVERKLSLNEVGVGIEMLKSAFQKKFTSLPVPDTDSCRKAFIEVSRKSPVQLAVELMEEGDSFHLLTDFTAQIICKGEQLNLVFGTQITTKPCVIFLLNPVLNNVLKGLGLKPTAFRHVLSSEVMAKLKAAAEGQEILSLIQNHNFHTITLHAKNGRVIRAECIENFPRAEGKKRIKQILAAVESGDFSTVTVQKTDGQIVSLERKTIIKFGKVTGET